MQYTFDKEKSKEVKGFAILLLLAYHLFEHAELVQSMGVNYNPFPLEGFLTATGFGNVCVSVFVFLTGYGITAGLLSQEGVTAKSAYSQACRRFGKLMLEFFALYLSVNLLWGFLFDYDALYGLNKQGMLYLMADATGLSQLLDTPTMLLTWWYMKVAYILVFLVPLLYFMVQKIGYAILPVAFFLPYVVSMDQDIQRYFFVAVFGVCAAVGKWPERLFSIRIHPVLRWVLGIVLLIVCVLIRQNYVVYQTFVAYVDAPIALFLVYFTCHVLGTIPFIRKALAFIGSHSLNIYLVHTFFYQALWREFIYSFKYAGLIFVVLLLTTLLYSIILEFFKNKVFKKIFLRIRARLE